MATKEQVNSAELLRSVLAQVAPGTELRDGLERILRGNTGALIVLGQDRRVVETHQPKASQLKMEENLIAGDYPIILYRKKREELKNV